MRFGGEGLQRNAIFSSSSCLAMEEVNLTKAVKIDEAASAAVTN